MASTIEPRERREYHIFLASPGDVKEQRDQVREFFDGYNRTDANPHRLHFEVVDWENYSSAGVGRPQELITEQTLQRYRKSLVLVIGIMAQRFGSPSGKYESGTEEEFECAVTSSLESSFPEVKWFFRDLEKLTIGLKDPDADLAQWKKVEAFRKRIETEKAVYSRSYKDRDAFRALLEADVRGWLNDSERPWNRQPSVRVWPQEVVAGLSEQLNDDFVQHMGPGDDLSLDEARSRYIPAVLKLRKKSDKSPSDTASEAGAEEQGPGKPDGSAPAPARPSTLSARVASIARRVEEGPLEDFLKPEGTQLLIVGEGGSGKTTMLKYLAAVAGSQAVRDPEAPVYIYLPLARYDQGGGLDFLLGLLSTAAGIEATEEFEEIWNSRRRIVFLLDGFHEVAEAFRASCTLALQDFLQRSPSHHRCVVTSRPIKELETAWSRLADNQRLQVADIMEIGPQQVEEYLKTQGQTGLDARISRCLEDLASNRFLHWAAINRVLARPQAGGPPRNSGSLFAGLIDRYLFGERKPRPTDYNYELAKKPVLAQLALRMSTDGVTVVKDDRDLWQEVAKYLVGLEQQYQRALPLDAETFMPKDYSAFALLREARNNDVLVREGDGLRFMHERVQEYFSAVALSASTVEDLARRVPRLTLAYLEAEGPVFKTLVTWAGPSSPMKVTALVESILDKNPLWAAHLAAESGLPEETLRKLRSGFLTLTTSDHEQRRRLGAMCLTVVPAEEPAVVSRLAGLLGDADSADVAKEALKAAPPRKVLAVLVTDWISNTGHGNREVGELLREMSLDHPADVADVLVDAWLAPASPKDRVAELASVLDAKEDSEEERRPIIRETLLIRAVEAELAGDLQGIAAADELRLRAGQVAAPAQGAPEEDDEPPTEFGASAAPEANAGLAPLIQAVLSGPQSDSLDRLESLPREPVRRYLEELIETSEGEVRERASLLAALMADRPSRAALDRIWGNSGEGLRAFAARAALRAGREGVELIIEHLDEEANGHVLEACIRALGESRDPVAVDRLLAILFDPAARRRWPRTARRHRAWAVVIHEALAGAGAADQVLKRVEQYLSSGLRGDMRRLAEPAVREASRWLPAPRAVELLSGAMTHADSRYTQQARWYLARTGRSDAWQLWLEAELNGHHLGYPRNPAGDIETAVTDSRVRNSLIAATRSVLRQPLFDSDRERRAAALRLTLELPEGWLDTAWSSEALNAAEDLMLSDDAEQRDQATQAISRFAPDGEERVFQILLHDPDDTVTSTAFGILGDTAGPRLGKELESALGAGAASAAGHIAGLLGRLVDSEVLAPIRESAAKWLDADEPGRSAAALLALAMLYSEDGEGWSGVSERGSAAFERHGPDKLWRQFAEHAASLDKEHRGFIYLILDGLAGQGALSPPLADLMTAAAGLWHDDVRVLGACIAFDIRQQHKDQAVARLATIATFPDVNFAWIGDRFADLGFPKEAQRAYRIAAERDPKNGATWGDAGWFAFLAGDYAESIDFTRRSLDLQPAQTAAVFNLGIALLARGDIVAAEKAYRRGIALAKRQAPADAKAALDGAIGDLSSLPALTGKSADSQARIRTWLESERNGGAAEAAHT